jgi:predicted nucleotidyltransferase
MEKDLVQGVKRVAQALNKHQVEYLFVGGVAIGIHGSPRPSANLPKDIEYDIDVWYRATNENFANLMEAIAEISPELKRELNEIIFDPKKTFIKFSLDKFQFDFLPELAAFYHRDFKTCFAQRDVAEIEGVEVNVISKNDLIRDKEKLARDKDKADIENLKKNSYKGL